MANGPMEKVSLYEGRNVIAEVEIPASTESRYLLKYKGDFFIRMQGSHRHYFKAEPVEATDAPKPKTETATVKKNPPPPTENR